MAFMSEQFQFREKKTQFQRGSFPSTLAKTSPGVVQVRGGKTDSGMKQQVRGNWISSMLHTTRSHTRLTAAHAKDAQTLAKVFLQRTDL